MHKTRNSLAALVIAAALVVTVSTPASAGTITTNAVSCGGNYVEIRSTGNGGGFHTGYTSPGVGSSKSFSLPLSPLAEKKTKFATYHAIYVGYANRSTAVSANAGCVA